MTMAIQYHLSMFSSAAAGVMNAVDFSYFLARARRMDPYDGVPAYRDPAIPAPYVQSLCPHPHPPPAST